MKQDMQTNLGIARKALERQPDGLPPLMDRRVRATQINGISRSFASDLSIVIPIHNEESGIRKTVTDLQVYLACQPWRTQVICVDDGSTDGTARIMAEMRGIEVIRSPEKRGYGSALKLGFARATGRYVGFIDADRTYPPKMIGPMIALLESRTEVPLCAGSRMLGRSQGLNLVRKAGNLLFTILSRVVCRTSATDVCSGMLLFRNELMEVLEVDGFTDDLDFALQMRCRCAMQGIPNLELPIPYDNRAGDSDLSLGHHGIGFLLRIAKERLRKPFRGKIPRVTSAIEAGRPDVVSVIVPVRDGEATIAACLRSLLACRRPAGMEAEIIVVDDGSIDATPQIVAGFPGVKYIRQLAAGPSTARNRGIAASTGEAILFTDDDCEVDEAWLVELVNTLRSTQAAAAGGSQHMHAGDRGLARDVSRFLAAVGFCGGYTKLGDAIREVQHNACCNSAYRREALLSVGGFSDDLWPGEDVELDLRIAKMGGRIVYNPRARVYHHRRETLSAFARMMKRYGCWSGGYLTRHFGAYRLLSWAPVPFALLIALGVWQPMLALYAVVVLGLLAIRLFTRAGVPYASMPRMLFLTLVGALCWNVGYIRGFFVGGPPRPGLVSAATQVARA